MELNMTAETKISAKSTYQSDGFLFVTDPPFDPELVQRASEGMDMIRRGEYDTGVPPLPSGWNPGDDENMLCKVEMPQAANLAIREIISHPELGRLAAEITGAEMVQVWWTQLLYKPPALSEKANTIIGWHQDRSYWQSWEEGSPLFTAWIALSDVTPDAGPMQLVRGSHRWGFFEGSDFWGQDNEVIRDSFALPDGAKWDPVAAILPPGGVSFHDNYTIHGSEINVSDRPRKSLAVHMRTEKAKRVVTSEVQTLLAHLDNPDYNPVIYDER
jgi:ectoine hydroxylase-related dioxygenase (phytanoyl-CoA dioxygenase family)